MELFKKGGRSNKIIVIKNNKFSRLIALDFDGVVIDSIEECYQVSKDVYYGFNQIDFDEVLYKSLFFEYRGLVGPAHEYLILHQLLNNHLFHDTGLGKENYEILKNKIDTATLDRFEFLFFSKRTYYQKTNFLKWVELNPITDFGNYLIPRNNEDIYIVTTKNRFATEALLKHYKISVREIFANDEIKTFGTKGKLISNILDRERIEQAYFIDDSISHLETVDDNRIKCFFADWGYGKNRDSIPFELARNIL